MLVYSSFAFSRLSAYVRHQRMIVCERRQARTSNHFPVAYLSHGALTALDVGNQRHICDRHHVRTRIARGIAESEQLLEVGAAQAGGSSQFAARGVVEQLADAHQPAGKCPSAAHRPAS